MEEDQKSLGRPLQTIKILDANLVGFGGEKEEDKYAGVVAKSHLNYIRSSQRRFVLDNGSGEGGWGWSM